MGSHVVRRPSLIFYIFDFFSETAEQNSKKLDWEQDLNFRYKVCVFRADQKNKKAALASDWLKHFRLLLWTEFNETWQGAIFQRLLPSLCFSGRSEKQDGRSGLWLTETFSSSETAERNSTTHDRKQDLNILYQVCVFVAIRKIRWPPRPLIRWDISISLKLLNGIQRNLIGSKISTSSTKFVFFGPIGKARWPPRCLIGWYIFDFSSDNAERNSAKRDKKQVLDLNVLYPVRVFWPISKQKWPSWLIRQKGGVLYSVARYVALLVPCFVFPP